MAIPSLADAKKAVTSSEIAPYEAAITKHLEQASTVSYLEDATQPKRVVIRTFPGKILSDLGIAALKASIEAAGWTNVAVINTSEPPRQGIGSSGAAGQPMVQVTFEPAAGTPPTGEDG